jgi:hypothetical protein
MRSLLLAVVLVGSPVLAADIGGTFTGMYVSTDSFGIPTVDFAMNLTCTLTCTTAAPVKHFGLGTINAVFASEPQTQLCLNAITSLGSDVDLTGAAVSHTNPPPGSRVLGVSTGVTCWCGGSLARGQGGYIDLQTAPVIIPPTLKVLSSSPRAGEDLLFVVNGAPRGSETIDVTASGAGVSFTATLGPADLANGNSCPTEGTKLITVTPSSAGTLTMTATFQPGGSPVTVTQEIAAGSSTGGGSGSTGGGSGGSAGGGSGGGSAPGGCVAVPSSSLAGLGLLLLALRRRLPRCAGEARGEG